MPKTLLFRSALCLVAALHVHAAAAPAGAELEERTTALAQQLRCVVCQNQTIADSQAELAVDLRRQVRSQLAEGRSDEQVLDYMVQRYGDFVLYKPPVRGATLLLWGGPAILLAAGLFALIRVLRRQPQEEAEEDRLLALEERP